MVLDSLVGSGEVEYRRDGEGRGSIMPTILNVCRVVCSLCGIRTERMSVAEMATEIRVKLVFSKYGGFKDVLDVMGRIIPPRRSLFLSLQGSKYVYIESLFSAGGGYANTKIERSEGKMRFEVAKCLCRRSWLGASDIVSGNIVDYLGEAYLRHYHNEQQGILDVALGSSGHRYPYVYECCYRDGCGYYHKVCHYDEGMWDRYIVVCLDGIFKSSSDHPRLREIRDLVVRHRNGVVQEVFAAAVEGKGYRVTKEVVERVGVDLLDYLIRRGDSRELPNEVVEGIAAVAVNNNRRDMVGYISENFGGDAVKRGLVGGFCLLVRDSFMVYDDKLRGFKLTGADYVFRSCEYSMILQKYWPGGALTTEAERIGYFYWAGEALTPKVEMDAMKYCYDYFLGQGCSHANDLSLSFLVNSTLDRVDGMAEVSIAEAFWKIWGGYRKRLRSEGDGDKCGMLECIIMRFSGRACGDLRSRIREEKEKVRKEIWEARKEMEEAEARVESGMMNEEEYRQRCNELMREYDRLKKERELLQGI
jgi:hypothetical protein